MNWKYVKAILIILLIAVNCLLGYFLYTSYSDTEFTDYATAEKTSAILHKSGIEVNPALLAVKNDSALSLNAKHQREDYLMMVASFLLGTEKIDAFLLPDGIFAVGEGNCRATVKNDMSISFSSGIDEDLLNDAIPIRDE